MKKITSQIFLALICVLLGFMLTHQFRMLNSKDTRFLAGERVSSYYDISDENDELMKLKEQLEKENSNVLTQLKKYEQDATNSNELTKEIKDKLDTSRVMLGMTSVSGPGVTIYLSPKSSIFNSSNNRYINYRELVYLINELYFAGAEAITINDNRILYQSVIKAANNNEYIQVNDDKIYPKNRIVVKAIGDKDKLEDALNFPLVLEYEALSNYDIKVEKSDQIKMPKYNKPFKEEFIQPVEKK
jgi:uncharacterized protein YlxW (UPF0749 family)